MIALSLWQPWAHAVTHLGKRVENRNWKMAPGYRGPILIHASKNTGTRDDFNSAVETILDIAGLAAPDGFAEAHYRRGEDCGGIWIPSPELPRGALVARARLVDVVKTSETGHRRRLGEARTCLLCGGPISDRAPAPCPSPDPWAIPGTLGFLLADVEPLEKPTPWKGMQGFFEVPDDVFRPGPLARELARDPKYTEQRR